MQIKNNYQRQFAIANLRAENFKSWHETGEIKFAPLTGFFGSNSSGKTAILQLLLMLKQTVETIDRQRILDTRGPYIDLGTFSDIISNGQTPGKISFSLDWKLAKTLEILDPEGEPEQILFSIPELNFAATIEGTANSISVEQFSYNFSAGGSNYQFGMQVKGGEYQLISSGYELKRNRGRGWALPPPLKSYRFPDKVNTYYQNASFLSDFVLAFEDLWQNVYYLGPLRDYPQRQYLWTGEKPQDVGKRGEFAVAALLASQKLDKNSLIEEWVAEKLRDLKLIDDFTVKPIGENSQYYEVRVRRSPTAPSVLITDVGFGVSQILPVLVLCYYVPKGSTIILEHPAIHLHPSVQAGLADVLIDGIKSRNLQVILESHSEYLLRRLQRRVAEEQLNNEEAALYFCDTDNSGKSQLTPLELDTFGNIRNWPKDFFGDELGEIAAKTTAEMKRKMEAAAE